MLARSKNEEPKRISPAERTYRFSSSIRLEAAKIGSLARVVLPLLLRPNITVKGRRLSRVYALNARYPSHSTTCSATMSPLCRRVMTASSSIWSHVTGRSCQCVTTAVGHAQRLSRYVTIVRPSTAPLACQYAGLGYAGASQIVSDAATGRISALREPAVVYPARRPCGRVLTAARRVPRGERPVLTAWRPRGAVDGCRGIPATTGWRGRGPRR